MSVRAFTQLYVMLLSQSWESRQIYLRLSCPGGIQWFRWQNHSSCRDRMYIMWAERLFQRKSGIKNDSGCFIPFLTGNIWNVQGRAGPNRRPEACQKGEWGFFFLQSVIILQIILKFLCTCNRYVSVLWGPESTAGLESWREWSYGAGLNATNAAKKRIVLCSPTELVGESLSQMRTVQTVKSLSFEGLCMIPSYRGESSNIQSSVTVSVGFTSYLSCMWYIPLYSNCQPLGLGDLNIF